MNLQLLLSIEVPSHTYLHIPALYVTSQKARSRTTIESVYLLIAKTMMFLLALSLVQFSLFAPTWAQPDGYTIVTVTVQNTHYTCPCNENELSSTRNGKGHDGDKSFSEPYWDTSATSANVWTSSHLHGHRTSSSLSTSKITPSYPATSTSSTPSSTTSSTTSTLSTTVILLTIIFP